MNSNIFVLRLHDNLPSVRRLGLFVAAVALAAMGIVGLAVNISGGTANGFGTRPVLVANNRNDTPVTTPTIPSAGAKVIPPAWQGGGWPGMGPFHGGGWPGQ
jgi:hypothetical protein